jgi:hypothetical protein
MEKKITILSLIFIIAVVISASLFIIFSGITANDYNYVLLEVNPKVEFICDNNFKVLSVNPLNEDGEILLSNVDYKGLDIEVVAVDFLNECAKTGYLDVDGNDNAINITVIDGITQALDVHVTQKVYEYLKKKEILCAVVENYEDRSMFDRKKENKICCANKYKLITTLMDRNENNKLETLKNLSEVELINIVANEHIDNPYIPSEDSIKLKEKLVELNKDKYNHHINTISNNSQKEFIEIFDEFQKTSGKKYMENFEKEYSNWHNNLVS